MFITLKIKIKLLSICHNNLKLTDLNQTYIYQADERI